MSYETAQYNAYLPDGSLIGTGNSKESAVVDAIRTYLTVDDYGEWPRFPDRQTLTDSLDIERTNHDH